MSVRGNLCDHHFCFFLWSYEPSWNIWTFFITRHNVQYKYPPMARNPYTEENSGFWNLSVKAVLSFLLLFCLYCINSTNCKCFVPYIYFAVLVIPCFFYVFPSKEALLCSLSVTAPTLFFSFLLLELAVYLLYLSCL